MYVETPEQLNELPNGSIVEFDVTCHFEVEKQGGVWVITDRSESIGYNIGDLMLSGEILAEEDPCVVFIPNEEKD